MEIVIKVNYLKNGYEIKTDKNKYIIDDFYYKILIPYANKELNDDQINELCCFSNAFSILKKQYRKIFNGEICKKDLYFTLKNANLSNEEIRIIINKLKAEGYLDEKKFIEYHKPIYELNKGIKAFKAFLESKQIKEENIANALDNYQENYDYLQHYANSFVKRKISSKKLFVQQLTQYLSNKGFSNEIINKVIENIEFKDELTNLSKEYLKYKKMYDNSYKVLSKLIQKGYNIEEIKKVMESDDHEN